MENGKISKMEYFLRLLFPPSCICCNSVLPINTREEICSICKENLKVHKVCEFENPIGVSITKIYSAFDYEGGIRKAIHRLKFDERPQNARVLIGLSYPILVNHLNGQQSPFMRVCKYDIIIPAPIHPARSRQRGYNQSELLASSLSSHMKVPMVKGVLHKKVNTPPQSKLGRGERLNNLIGAFHVKNLDLIKGQNVLLVDDIMTTGSTLEQCGKVLIDAGAVRVDAYVVAMRRRL